MKRALLVGIDAYDRFPPLWGCVNDVVALHPHLARHEDGSPNLECQVVTTRPNQRVSRDELVLAVDRLLAPGASFAVLYFAGHGTARGGDVALTTSDGTTTTPGMLFAEVLERIGNSPVTEVAVLLDCCFSGGATNVGALGGQRAVLPDGLSVLTASRGDQLSAEGGNGRGQFSSYVEAALAGGAADVLGSVTMAGVYAYVSESFGAWDQRPTFKANIESLHEIRRCEPRVPLSLLRRLPTWFPTAEAVMALDPSYEPDADPPHREHEEVFAGLQQLRAARLLEPVGADHLYFAAMRSTGCALTPLGRHYWQRAASQRL